MTAATVLVTIPEGHAMSLPDLARYATRFEGARTHRLAVSAGARLLTLPEEWNVEPREELLAELRRAGVKVEVLEDSCSTA